MLKTGTVLWFDEVKGFGFISQDSEPGKDLFVHFRGVNSNGNERVLLKPQQRVSYDVQEGKKGLSAVNVTVI
ncbi:MAG: cold-shock protein [Epsilonproteobacteria bacterium]|nr:cold-shock protein [Campylobacterota bacterium]